MVIRSGAGRYDKKTVTRRNSFLRVACFLCGACTAPAPPGAMCLARQSLLVVFHGLALVGEQHIHHLAEALERCFWRKPA